MNKIRKKVMTVLMLTTILFVGGIQDIQLHTDGSNDTVISPNSGKLIGGKH